jgi:hypothetical protein
LSGFDEASLREAGMDAMRLLRSGQYAALAQQHGYALAYGRPVAAAIEEDHRAALAQLHVDVDALGEPSFEVVRYEPNDSGLLGALEATCLAREDAGLLVDLVVTHAGGPRITLEEIGAFGAE